ncbi:MAG: HAMP domain-containing protein [Cocleimonas sp.]|nr:HAMP domain-containing protein [Cocleimonas sp.]
MKKIRNKLLFSMLLVTILPLLLVGGYSLYSTTDSLRQSSVITLENKVSLVSERVGNFLENVSSDLFYLRDSSAVNLYLSGLEGDKESSQLLLENLISNLSVFSRKRKIYHQIRFINTDGMEIVRVNYNGSDVSITEKDKLQNKKGRYYFDDTIKLKKDELMISPLDLNREKNKVEIPVRPTIRYATPIFNESNKLQGIIILNVLAKNFLDIISRENREGETLAFVNNDGYYYQHPNESKLWGSKRDLGTGINLFTDKSSVQKSIIKQKSVGHFETGDDIASYTPVLLNNGQYQLGTIIDFVPKEVVFAPMSVFMWIFLGIALLALLGAFLLAAILSSSISRPLETLKDEVEKLAKGDMSSAIDVETNDEIGELSHAVEKLRRSMQILMRRAGR